jgi:hypothetical protein
MKNGIIGHMHGLYKVYIDGNLVGEYKNGLTEAGRTIIMKTLLGIVPSIDGTIAIGCGDKANTFAPASNLISDKRLHFPALSFPVMATSLDRTGETDAIVFRAQITEPARYVVTELGLYPFSTNSLDAIGTTPAHRTIFDGSTADAWKIKVGTIEYGVYDASYLSGTPTSRQYLIGSIPSGVTAPRVKNSLTFLKASDIIYSYKTSGVVNFSQVTDGDKLDILYTKTGTSAATVKIRFYTSNTEEKYYEFSGNTASAAGHGVLTFEKRSAVPSGTPASWAAITKISITSTADIYLDAIKFNNDDFGTSASGANLIDSSYGMISRAVLSTPIVKPEASTIDIEYFLTLGFNVGS